MSLNFLFGIWMRLVTPAEPLHELTHMVVALPVASKVGYERGPDGTAFAVLEWPTDAPVVWVRVAHLAPTIVGTLSAVIVAVAFPDVVNAVGQAGAWAAISVGLPGLTDEAQLMLSLVLATNWVIFSIPSQQDLRPFQF
jgi:hypothetical protein